MSYTIRLLGGRFKILYIFGACIPLSQILEFQSRCGLIHAKTIKPLISISLFFSYSKLQKHIINNKYQEKKNHYHIYFFVLLTNLTGTSATPSVRPSLASRTRSRHSSFVSPIRKRGSILKSRRSKVKKQTDSTVANLRPMQARGPNAEKLGVWMDSIKSKKKTYRYWKLRKLRRWKDRTNEKVYISQVRQSNEGYILSHI